MELTPVAARVLGCLLEKQRTTPDLYPLSLNSVVGACNQTTNRWPVVRYDESVVQAGLDELRDMFWHAVTPSLGRPTAEEADLLPLFLRPDAFGHDTNAAERAAETIHGAGAGRAIRDKADAIQHKRSAPPPPALPPSPSSVRPKGK